MSDYGGGMGYQERIAALPPVEIICTPGVMGGIPCVGRTRIPADTIFACIGGGDSAAEIYAGYPSLPAGSLEAVVAWAKAAGHDISVPVRRMPD